MSAIAVGKGKYEKRWIYIVYSYNDICEAQDAEEQLQEL